MMTDPPMSLGVCLRVHSFVRSIHKAEAGDAPLGTRLIGHQRSDGENNAGFSVSSSCLDF